MNTTQASGPGGQDGTVIDLTMQGDGIYECVYTIPAYVGSSSKQLNFQIDTGSSDVWLASTSCSSRPSCSAFTGPRYDPSSAQATGKSFSLSYQSGTVSGPIYVDKLELGGYTINNQVLAAASDIVNENLSIGAGFTGLIGLAPQANSIIANQLQNFAVNNATFATNLFSNSSSDTNYGSLRPKNHFISLLLERPYFPNVSSRLGLGAHPPLPSPLSPSQVQMSAILPSNPGPLFWRVPITQVTAYVNGSPQLVKLSSTQATDVSSIWPVAVFDSGGQFMISTRSFANTFYGAWGIGPGSQDGQYYVPCKLAMNVSITLGQDVSVVVPIHPIDMSFAIQSQPQDPTCLGALQASDDPISQGDLILGAAFMRNVYTVLSYESDPPQLGILPLTNPVTALAEFNTVRVLRQPIGSGLSPSQGSSSASSGKGTASGNSQSNKVGLKILGGVVGALVFAVVLLCLSIRLLRRRLMQRRAEESGAVHEEAASAEKPGSEHQKRLQYGGAEEAFSMFGSGDAGTLREVNIGEADRFELEASDKRPQSLSRDIFYPPQPSEGRRSSDSLSSAFKDSRYPRSRNSSLRSLDTSLPPLQTLEYSRKV